MPQKIKKVIYEDAESDEIQAQNNNPVKNTTSQKTQKPKTSFKTGRFLGLTGIILITSIILLVAIALWINYQPGSYTLAWVLLASLGFLILVEIITGITLLIQKKFSSGAGFLAGGCCSLLLMLFLLAIALFLIQYLFTTGI